MPNKTSAPLPEAQTPADDQIIGVAFRWSLVALGAIALLVGGVAWYLKSRPAGQRVQLTRLSAPLSPERMEAEIPLAVFKDITAEAGIRFVHNNGAYGEKLLPETMGSGVAFLDFDNDGDQDLLLVNGTSWAWKDPERQTTAGLYRNDGSGRFDDVTAGSGLDVSFYGMGVATGDYDGDGLVDVYLTGLGGNSLFHNEGGGRFRDVTASAGVQGSGKDWSTSAAWIDIENDGDLDLFVCNYVQWSREIDLEVDYRLVGIGRAYGPPMNFPGTFPLLFRNDGAGRFTDISREAGVQIKNPASGVPMAKSLAVAPVDVNGDNFIDLVVANDTVQNFLFTNQGNGSFQEIGARSGIAFDDYGQTRGAMGIDAARFRNDGALGIAIGNFANEPNALYVSQQDSVIFADEAITEGVGPASRLLLKFGLFFFDYDLDGRLDVLTANGHLEEDIHKIQRSQQYRQPAQLFWNRGASAGMSFVTVPPAKCGEDLFKPIVGRGSAFGDIDNDGDLDVVMTQVSGPPLLLRNEQKLGHNWLRLKLVGNAAAPSTGATKEARRNGTNRDAIGAWIRVRVGSQTLSRQVMPTRSYLSQSELPVTIGIGKANGLDAVEILWPSGRVQRLEKPALNQLTVVREPSA